MIDTSQNKNIQQSVSNLSAEKKAIWKWAVWTGPATVLLLALYKYSLVSIFFWTPTLNIFLDFLISPIRFFPKEWYAVSGGMIALPNPITILAALALIWLLSFGFAALVIFFYRKLSRVQFLCAVLGIMVIFYAAGYWRINHCVTTLKTEGYSFSASFLGNTGSEKEKVLEGLDVFKIQTFRESSAWIDPTNPTKFLWKLFYFHTGIEKVDTLGGTAVVAHAQDPLRKVCYIQSAYAGTSLHAAPFTSRIFLYKDNHKLFKDFFPNDYCQTATNLTSQEQKVCQEYTKTDPAFFLLNQRSL